MAKKPKDVYLVYRVDLLGKVELHQVSKPFPAWVKRYIKVKVWEIAEKKR